MKNTLGVSPSNGNHGTTQGKEKVLSCPTSWLSRQSSGRSNPEVVGSIPTEVFKVFSFYLVWFPDYLN